MRSPLLAVIVALTCIACGGPPLPDGPDAGLVEAPDAGEMEPGDAGAQPDAGPARADLILKGIRLGIVGEMGKRLRAVVVHEASDSVVAVLDEPIDGPRTYTLPEVVSLGELYGLHLYVDMDEDGVCDPSTEEGGDRGWSVGSVLGREGGTEVHFHTRWIDEEVCAHFR